MSKVKAERSYSEHELEAIGDLLIAALERDHLSLKYCLLLVGANASGKSNSRLVSNIERKDLRQHFLNVLDNPTSIDPGVIN